MSSGPALPGYGRDEDAAGRSGEPGGLRRDGAPGGRPAFPGPGWMDDAEREAYLAALASEDEPDDPDLYDDPDSAPPDLDDAQLAALMAGAQEVTAAGFAHGTLLDGGPGCTALMGFADDAAGTGDRYAGACDDEVIGAVRAWDRIEAHAAARKHAALAELIRRFPEPGCASQGEGAARIPEVWDEFLPDELALALAESRFAAENLLDLAWDLEVKLPRTMGAFRSGTLRQRKVEIIARAVHALDPEEARAAEALVLDRADRLTPGGLRAAIARAVMEVAPQKARKRREDAARDARVERWAEDSGNAALAGRELPPAEVLAADQRVTWWAQQLKKAGLSGDMDQLRARSFLDILLDVDSRPDRTGAATADGKQDGPDGPHGGPDDRQGGPEGRQGGSDGETKGQAAGERADSGPDARTDGGGGDGSGPDSRGCAGAGPAGPGGPTTPGPGRTRPGAIPPGFVGRVMLTVPLTTVLHLADRPGAIPGIGPVDPALARDLASAAARNPRTTWCVTITDQDGHTIGHGCARPEPRNSRAARQKPGPPGGHDPPRGTGGTNGPGFSFTAAGQLGPAGGYGTWRLSTGTEGQPGLILAIEPIAAGQCDHRHQAHGHDPGVLLRHLTEVQHATCTGPSCRRPAAQCDFEHDVPYETGGRTCICNGDPKCRHDHRLKQDPRWKVEKLANGNVRWTTPTGRQYTTEPTRYPI